MKILAASDIHNDITKVQALAEKADKENVDLVILAGDILENDKFKGNIIGPFLKKNKRVLFLPGNHESFATAEFIAEHYKIKNLHSYATKYDDIGFFGCGGTNIGLFQLSEDEIMQALEKSYNYIKELPKKIMVTHVHPSDTIAENFTQFFPGSSAVKAAIDKFQPDLMICGHVHEAEGIEEIIGKTKVINVGGKGKIINI